MSDYSDPLPREPVRVGHRDNPPPSAETVLAGYANVIDTLDEFNSTVEPERRVSIPFGIQEVLWLYIEERRTIERLTA